MCDLTKAPAPRRCGRLGRLDPKRLRGGAGIEGLFEASNLRSLLATEADRELAVRRLQRRSRAKSIGRQLAAERTASAAVIQQSLRRRSVRRASTAADLERARRLAPRAARAAERARLEALAAEVAQRERELAEKLLAATQRQKERVVEDGAARVVQRAVREPRRRAVAAQRDDRAAAATVACRAASAPGRGRECTLLAALCPRRHARRRPRPGGRRAPSPLPPLAGGAARCRQSSRRWRYCRATPRFCRVGCFRRRQRECRSRSTPLGRSSTHCSCTCRVRTPWRCCGCGGASC